jgi:Y_Y_Y domain/Two component regulator propeller
MKIRHLFTLTFVLASFLLRAQSGNYFLSHYTPTDERIDYLTFEMAQDDRGVIYFANKKGVLQFDGRNWSLIPTPAPIYTIVTSGKDVFVGGFNGFGKLVWDPQNMLVYKSISANKTGAIQVISSLAVKDKIYFLSEDGLYTVSATTSLTESVVKAEAQDVFTGMFEIVGNIYVNTENRGLLKIDHGKLIKANFGLPGNLDVMFCSPLQGSDKVLIASTSNRLFIFDANAGLRELHLKDETFLEANLVVNGTWVNEKLIAIGTLRGGVLFFNPNTGNTEEVTNYYTGLPDNEIYSILCDRNQGIWVAHDYGFTRISPYLPFRSYSHYPGLEGNLLCARGFKGQIYVGTTLGLFNLVKQEVYADEPDGYVGQPKIKSKPAKTKTGGFFSFLRRDKNKSTEAATTEKGAKSAVTKGGAAKTHKVLKSLQYVFKRVSGVDGKVNQLTEANDRLLASGITGILEVDGLKSVKVMPQPVRSVFMSSSIHQLIISTLDDELKTFTHGAKGWQETHLLDTIQESINYIFEDKLQNIWLCGKASVLKVETVDNEIIEINHIPLNNPSIDEPVGLAFGSNVYVAASGNFNKYDVSKNRFVKFDLFDSLPGPKKYFASADYFWFFDGRHWHTVDPKLERSLKLQWLGLFQNIRFLSLVGRDQGLWVITAGNELYKFSSNKALTESGVYPLFLREVRGQQNKIVPAKYVKVSQLESTVAFEFIQPDYFGFNSMEYRYHVPGLSKKWVEYSPNNNIVNFPYLPTGSYKVEIQTRDLLGKESKIEQVDLEVEPPYWRQSWFYATEFAFFAMLVFLSVKLSAANSKYRYISSLLSVLTVIMLIQFIQTIVASQISIKSTPVIDFFIQVFIALLVLPLEGYLRKFMIRSGENEVKAAQLVGKPE